MAEIICYHNGKYNIYGTISDSFFFDKPLTLETLTEYIQFKYGDAGMRKLPERLDMAHESGCSSLIGMNLKELLECNRAGEDEEHLSYEDCLRLFFDSDI